MEICIKIMVPRANVKVCIGYICGWGLAKRRILGADWGAETQISGGNPCFWAVMGFFARAKVQMLK